MLDLLFVMDPLSGLDPRTDSTLALIEAAEKRGHRVRSACPRELVLRGGELLIGGDPVAVFDAAFLRTDPPFDVDYLTATLLLDHAACLMVNEPRGVRNCNEKLHALRFPAWTPQTLVASNPATLREFLTEVGGEMIVKPLDRCGGSGVLHIRADDRNTPSLLELATDDGRRAVVAQRYLPGARRGDKRILLLDGEPIGALLRVPPDDDIRANLHVGGLPRATTLTSRERALCAAVGERCRREGLSFVGIDVIDGYLTEINVTSPTGLRELAELTGGDPAGTVIDWVESCVARPGLVAA